MCQPRLNSLVPQPTRRNADTLSLPQSATSYAAINTIDAPHLTFCQTRDTSAVFTYFEEVVHRLPQSLWLRLLCCIQCGSATSNVMENRSAPILPTYAESWSVYISFYSLYHFFNRSSICSATSDALTKDSLCRTLFPYNTLKEPDPVIILITLAVVIGSFCLLSGFFLLCVVSKAWQDETSEAILLMGKCKAFLSEYLI